MTGLRRIALLAGLLGLPAAVNGGDPGVELTVLFSPAVHAALESIYGTAEEAVLQRTIRERVTAALRGAGCDGASQAEITLLEARPTHPTDKQLMDNPALDRLRTRFVGGATFGARLLDAAGHELKSLRYDWYAEDIRHGSRSAAPWGDARLASEGLGSQLAHECRALASAHQPAR